MPARLPALLLLSAACALAAPPIATVTSPDPFEINGVALTARVPSTPLVPGDTLATTTASAILLLQDHSRLTLEKNSRLKLERNGDQILVRLLAGALAYKLAPKPRLQFIALGQSVKPPSTPQGRLAITNNQLVTSSGVLPSSSSALDEPCCPPPPVSKHR